MIPAKELRTWTRQIGDLTCTISTDPSQIQLGALNDAFASDMLYWAKPLSPEALKLCVEQSLCFGLYVQQRSQQEGESIPTTKGSSEGQEMIGFGRLVTDYVTFAYLTDVYVIAQHQGKGLGKWMMQCLDEVLRSWPDLRRCVLLTRGAAAVRMYGETIGARDISETSSSLVVLERPGPAAPMAGEEDKGRKGGGARVDGAREVADAVN
ncbi:hypothetical protein C8A03DRAFT_34810 [Achaetomium macrosporum]|uniref:N-acetyltransferase domain-containing protein n=1 Tax=Achaetomium macrosporum TaxID=79813 RepID=A0AAN7HA16_9PEZI|nr:hypothetical protein C8A03DRAFT_34810 [Achaetomium macrosporum]